MSDTIAVSSVIADLAPYALAMIPVVIGWGVQIYSKATHSQISANAVTKLDILAKAEAGAAIAASETNLAGVSVTVGSGIVADAVTSLVAKAPSILNQAGLSPDQVATIIQGHIGFAQGSAPVPAAPPVAGN